MFVENVDEASGPERPLPRPLGRLRPWIEWFGVGRLIAGAVTVVLLVGVGWWLLRSPSPPTEAGLPRASTIVDSTTVAPSASGASAVAAPPASAGPLVVHVAGAVVQPGVYELAPGARVQGAIEAAGGAAPGADPGALNLAAPVADGERVYVPVVGETVPMRQSPQPPEPAAAPGPVDLNRASAGELDELPGIGPATAAAIVEHREQHGPFASVEDLEAVRGIGPAKLDALRDLVSV